MPIGRGPGRGATPKLVAAAVTRPKTKRVVYDVWELWVERHAATPQGADFLEFFPVAVATTQAEVLAKTFGTVGALQLHYVAWLKDALAPTQRAWFASTESLETHWTRRVAPKQRHTPPSSRPR